MNEFDCVKIKKQASNDSKVRTTHLTALPLSLYSSSDKKPNGKLPFGFCFSQRFA
ncbi:hypothetical protein [Moraxella lacunata]|uniref:hypothetical protein n=1 Tax=Moraxella lacunata TaxID=477 RepID=UPI003EDFB71A